MALLANTNYKSGIDVTFSGTNGTDWMEEYYCHEPKIGRGKVVFIRAATEITAAHNARNVIRRAGSYYELASLNGNADDGLIRYRVDGDLHWGPKWTTGQGGTANPAYSAPFTFATLSYAAGASGGVAVLGRTGDNGASLVPKSGYFHYGHLDAAGNEIHTIAFADDDYALTTTDTEWRSSDGRWIPFAVNPRTPCLQVRASGNAQFYTTPLKTYFIPKIHAQTTYIYPRTGGIEIELKALTGEDCYYRINGGSWVQANNPTLTHADFSTGSNTLEYYYEGNTAHIATRTIIKNPGYPSAGEDHGLLAFGSEDNYTATLSRLTRAPYAFTWGRILTRASTGGRDVWESNRNQGLRYVPKFALANAVAAKVQGITARQPGTGTGTQRTYSEYAKEMVLDNAKTIDPIGFEMLHPQTTLPCREIVYRGYWDVGTCMDLIFAYDLLISIYKESDHASGITPIEDLMIRDSIAQDVVDCLFFSGNFYSDFILTSGGMWDTSRKCAALFACLALPTYSTAYYGTCGLDGTTTTYPWTPFKDYPLTWKKVFLDDNDTIRGYPNLAQRLGIDEYNCAPNGDFYDRVSYCNLIGPVFATVGNVLKYRYPQKSLPNMEAFFLKCTNGTVRGLQDNSGPARFIFLLVYNSSFPSVADIGIPLVADPVTGSGSDDSLIGPYMPTAAMWYEDTYVPGSGSPQTAPIFTVQPVSATRTEGEAVTFTVATSGNPTPTRQWRKDGANISGQTGTSYTIASTVVGDAGIYDCVATNSVAPSGVTSAAATLVVNAIPPTPDPVTKRTNYKTPSVVIFAT